VKVRVSCARVSSGTVGAATVSSSLPPQETNNKLAVRAANTGVRRKDLDGLMFISEGFLGPHEESQAMLL
jgi:hypothetical protein